MFTDIHAAIIDLDGTMIDTAPDMHLAINRMRADLQLAPIDIAMVKDFVGKGTENLIRRVLAVDYAEDDAEQYFDEALAAYQKHYHAVNGEFSALYPEVREGLIALKSKGLRLACVTNKPIAFTIPLLEKTDLLGHFEVVYGGDSLPKKKPDPTPLLQVCTDFGLRPPQVIAIGDSSNDAQAARAAGCRVLNVPYGYNHGQSIQEVDSDGIVSSLLEAACLISIN